MPCPFGIVFGYLFAWYVFLSRADPVSCATFWPLLFSFSIPWRGRRLTISRATVIRKNSISFSARALSSPLQVFSLTFFFFSPVMEPVSYPGLKNEAFELWFALHPTFTISYRFFSQFYYHFFPRWRRVLGRRVQPAPKL